MEQDARRREDDEKKWDDAIHQHSSTLDAADVKAQQRKGWVRLERYERSRMTPAQSRECQRQRMSQTCGRTGVRGILSSSKENERDNLKLPHNFQSHNIRTHSVHKIKKKETKHTACSTLPSPPTPSCIIPGTLPTSHRRFAIPLPGIRSSTAVQVRDDNNDNNNNETGVQNNRECHNQSSTTGSTFRSRATGYRKTMTMMPRTTLCSRPPTDDGFASQHGHARIASSSIDHQAPVLHGIRTVLSHLLDP